MDNQLARCEASWCFIVPFYVMAVYPAVTLFDRNRLCLHKFLEVMSNGLKLSHHIRCILYLLCYPNASELNTQWHKMLSHMLKFCNWYYFPRWGKFWCEHWGRKAISVTRDRCASVVNFTHFFSYQINILFRRGLQSTLYAESIIADL